jgi:hypothetical protein
MIAAAVEEKLAKIARSAGRSEFPVPTTYGRDSSTY